MTQAKELDIGPLAWVSGEIEQALERAAEAIAQVAADPEQHTQLQFARTHLHQARGALSIVGLDGACQFADTLDALLSGMQEGRLPVDATNTGLARRACSAISNYLAEIVGGAGDQPLRLFALYRELTTADGRSEVSAADMFFPDLERRMPRRRLEGAPRPGTPAGEQQLRGARASLERGLLLWLRDPEDPAGASLMRDAAVALEALQASPAFHTLWRVAQAFFDSLVHHDLPASTMRIRQICTGLAKEVRNQSGNAHQLPERLMRDLLFEIGQAPVRTPAQREVRNLWDLDAWWAEPGNDVADIPLGPLLRKLRGEIAHAKRDWDAFGMGGQAAALQDFNERIQRIAGEAAQLGRPALKKLLDGTAALSRWVIEDPVARMAEPVAIEVATALLLAELGVEGGIADAELSSQGNAILARFQAWQQGEAPPATDESTLDAARRAHEWDARQQVVREVSTNLGQIEQTLDDFFRDHAKRTPLSRLALPMRQIEGALSLIGGEEALPLVRKAAETIERFALEGAPSDEAELAELADQISTLGFFVSALQHGQARLDSFLPAEQRSQPPAAAPDASFEAGSDFEIDFSGYGETAPALATETTGDGAAQEAEPTETDAAARPTTPATRAPAPEISAPAPSSDAAVDAELLAIFIEEAHDVLGTIHDALERIASRDEHDALIDIRRGFHTLKGSGRMVGLSELGEAAWAIEQTLNRWLHLEWPASEALQGLIADAHQAFSGWVGQIEAGGSHSWPFAPIARLAEQLRQSDSDSAAPTAELAQTAEASAPTPAPQPSLDEHHAAPAGEELEEPSLADDATSTAESLALDEPDETEPAAGDSVDEKTATADEAAAAPAAPFFDFGDLDLPSLELDDVEDFVELDTIEAAAAPADPASADITEAPAALTPADDLQPAAEPAAASAEAQTTAALAPSAPDDSPAATDETPAAPSIPATVRLGETELSRPLFELYLAEARGHIEVLQEGLRPLRRNPSPPSEKLLRAAHTLAGISGTAHVPPLQDLARAMEFTLHRLREGPSLPAAEAIELLATTTDTLDAMLGEVAQEQLPLAVPELEQQLDSAGRPRSSESTLLDPVPGTQDTDEAAADATADSPQSAVQSLEIAQDDEADTATTLHDDLDEQLLPIFLEEADELMGALHERLRLWQDDSANPEHAQLTARHLHTLKGSARMAGAMQLGELIHRIESRLETGSSRQLEPLQLIDDITSGLDQAAHMLAVLGGSEAPAPAAAEQGPAEASAPAISIDAGSEAVDSLPSGGTLRVRADTLSDFINTAGEIGIARTRIDGELRTLRRSLLDLTENVIRLRNQLREVELQAETQMQSRIAQADSRHGEFDPLEMDRYTRLQELTRMMAESVGDVTTVQQQLLRNLDGAELALHSQGRIARDLQQGLMQVRMVPFDSLADRLYRVVRQSAKDEGKRVNLDIRGGRIGIDRSVLEHITTAIEHMLRNAVAHGIEPAQERLDAGKNEIGQITLSISQSGNEIAINLADDGRGLDYASIAERARERGLLAADETPDEQRLTNLIFSPGFSTAGSVSALAGRGVGMDVVRAETAALGGRIDVQATPGQGTSFRIHLPLTLAVTQALLVRAAQSTYAIPSTMIAQAMELRADAIERVRSDGHIEWQGERYPYRYLPSLLGDGVSQPDIQRFNWILLLKAGGERLAVHVDALRGNQEIVVKSAGPQLLRIVGVSGATVLGDGEIVLILNPTALASRALPAATLPDGAALVAETAPVASTPQPPSVLIVDDSLTVRKITSRLLEREGYRVFTAKDGSDALDQLQETLPDVILSDIEMPRMDGFDFVRNLRADERTQDIPVVMITSRLADKHREYAAKLGANEYLGKPYDEDELLRLLQHYTADKLAAPVA